MAKLTFYGHATFGLETDDGTHVVIDPFFTDNPLCETSVDDVPADYILVTHGHGDHVGDLMGLAERTGATVVATYEIATYVESRGHAAVSPQHIGGGVQYDFGHVKLVPALHGGKVDLPDAEAFTTNPAGIVVTLPSGTTIYFTGDTALTMDMQLLRGSIDICAMCIGDRFTMGPADAVRAIDFIEPKVVIPFHYDTWPVIEQDTDAFVADVGDRAKVEVLKPGSVYEF